jgi:hypothetical protein
MSIEAEIALEKAFGEIAEQNPGFYERCEFHSRFTAHIDEKYPSLGWMEKAELVGQMMCLQFPELK